MQVAAGWLEPVEKKHNDYSISAPFAEMWCPLRQFCIDDIAEGRHTEAPRSRAAAAVTKAD